MHIFFKWFISALSIWIAAYIVPGVEVTLTSVLVSAVVLGALNLFIRPFLVLFTLPITVITLGLFSLVINAVLVMLTAYFVPDFHIPGFWTALFFALVLSVVNWVFHFWSRKS
jgi:putative membrane protein